MKTNELKNQYIQEMAKCWGEDEKMMIHFEKEISAVISLEDGKLIAIKKQKIKTEFCFSYSNSEVSEKEARAQANDAAKNQSYFIATNTKYLTSIINLIEEDKKLYLLQLVVRGVPVNIYKPLFLDLSQLRYQEQNGDIIVIATDTDKKQIETFYKSELRKKTNKLEGYIKRFGLTKVRTWTYWSEY